MRDRILKTLISRRFFLLTLSIAAAVCTSLLLLPPLTNSRQQANQRDRTVDTEGSYPECPIEIIGAETAKRKILLGKSFLDDDDWLKGLTVRVRNSSGKPLTHIGVKITFDRPQGQEGQAAATWDLWYGVSPFYYKPNEEIPPPNVPLVPHGRVELLSLSDSEYSSLRSFLTIQNFPTSVERIHLMVYTIGFADGTAWNGETYERDPKTKRGWKSREKPKGGANNRAAFLMRKKEAPPVRYLLAGGISFSGKMMLCQMQAPQPHVEAQ